MLSFNTQIRTVQVLVQLVAFVGLISWFRVDLLILVSIPVYVFMLGCITAGFHRRFAHRSYQTHSAIDWIMAIGGSLACLGHTFAWVGTHRLHHATADTVNDPHSPITQNPFLVWFGVWKRVNVSASHVKDLLRNTMHRWIKKYYFYVILTYVGLVALIDPVLIVYAFAVPAALVYHVTSFVNVCGHLGPGGRTNHSKNSGTMMGLITMGEGYHGTHHKYPNSYDFGFEEHRFDPTAKIIQFIRRESVS